MSSIETFNPAAFSRTETTAAPVTASKTVASSSKTTKPSGSSLLQRIDYEPLYTELKILIGHNWSIYHDALSKFVQGRISSDEFCAYTDSFVYATPQTENAHNAIICALVYNSAREPPEHPGPALWVTSASKSGPNGTSKPNIASDSAEQRLKAEVMALPSRDRRRLKNAGLLPDAKGDDDILRRRFEEQHFASRIRVPDSMPANAGAKTNWDMEIKKRYTQPLFAETLEFPDASTIYARMVPMCYEASVTSGPSGMPCADLVAVATQTYVKTLMAEIFQRTRANGPGGAASTSSGFQSGIATRAYTRQLEREESEFRHGRLQRGRDNGLLPVEVKQATTRRPLGMADLRIAHGVGTGLWNGVPLIESRIVDTPLDGEYDDHLEHRRVQGSGSSRKRKAALVDSARTDQPANAATGTQQIILSEVAVEEPEEDVGWQGCGAGEQTALALLLDDCLAIRA